MNTFNTPVVAYSGEMDAQKQAADVMEQAIRAEGMTLEHLIGPKTGHAYQPTTRLKLIARLDELAAKGRNPAPAEIRFTTWMLRYNKMYWIEIDGMDKEWERARVDAKVGSDGVRMTTVISRPFASTGVPSLSTAAAGRSLPLDIDGTRLVLPAIATDKSLTAGLIKTNGHWRVGTFPASLLRKTHGLQGPIDDAFMDSFVIVRPTGKAFSDALGQWEQGQLAFAISKWPGVLRGEPRVKEDVAVSDADMAAHNLVLFGDPSSNGVSGIARPPPDQVDAGRYHRGIADVPGHGLRTIVKCWTSIAGRHGQPDIHQHPCQRAIRVRTEGDDMLRQLGRRPRRACTRSNSDAAFSAAAASWNSHTIRVARSIFACFGCTVWASTRALKASISLRLRSVSSS